MTFAAFVIGYIAGQLTVATALAMLHNRRSPH